MTEDKLKKAQELSEKIKETKSTIERLGKGPYGFQIQCYSGIIDILATYSSPSKFAKEYISHLKDELSKLEKQFAQL